MSRLSSASKAVARGDWKGPVEAGGARELVELAGAFNQMTADSFGYFQIWSSCIDECKFRMTNQNITSYRSE